ncbi:MAG: flippase [Flavisolibacter sp.]
MKLPFSSYWIQSAFFTVMRRFSLTIFGFVNFVLLIRILTPDQMGVWALFLIITSIFETTKSGFVKNAHIRFVSTTHDKLEHALIASASLIINMVISLLFIGFILFFSGPLSSWLNAGNELSSMLYWFIPGVIAMIFFSHFEGILQSFLHFKGVFAGNLVRQIIFFLLISYYAFQGNSISLQTIAVLQFISIALGTLVLFIYTRRFLLFRFDYHKIWVRKILHYGSYIFGSSLMSNIFASIDQVMTAKFITSGTPVAYYNAASRINALLDMPTYAASEILFPKVAKANHEEGLVKVKYLFERMVAILTTLILPASILIIIFPEYVIWIIAGDEYLAAAPILQLYMLTGIMRPMMNQAANILNSIGKQALCFVINSISLAVNLGINYICLINFGLYGAAIGTLITSTLGTIVWYFVMKKQVGFELSNLLKYIIETYKQIYFTISGNLPRVKNINA